MAWTGGLYPLAMPCPAVPATSNFHCFGVTWQKDVYASHCGFNTHNMFAWSLFSSSCQLQIDAIHLNALNWYFHDKFHYIKACWAHISILALSNLDFSIHQYCELLYNHGKFHPLTIVSKHWDQSYIPKHWDQLYKLVSSYFCTSSSHI